MSSPSRSLDVDVQRFWSVSKELEALLPPPPPPAPKLHVLTSPRSGSLPAFFKADCALLDFGGNSQLRELFFSTEEGDADEDNATPDELISASRDESLGAVDGLYHHLSRASRMQWKQQPLNGVNGPPAPAPPPQPPAA
jgi:hypothetical protein